MGGEQQERLTLSIESAAKACGVSRNLYYELVRQHKAPGIRIGQKRLVVPKKQLEDYLSGNWRPHED